MAKVAILTGGGVITVDWFAITTSSPKMRYVNLTLMMPSTYSDDHGYTPAESVTLRLYQPQAEELFLAIENALNEQVQTTKENSGNETV